MERRFVAHDAKHPIAVRAETEGEGRKVDGIAAVYYDGTPGTEFELWEGARERIMPGAFDRAIKEDDVRALFNHDPNLVLGRTVNGTLTLRSGKGGLDYEIEPPDTQAGRDAVALLERGDVSGSSFSFRVTDEEWRKEDDAEIREVRGVALYDVGPVTFPAYEATTAGARTAGDVSEARASYDTWRDKNALEPEIETKPNANGMLKTARVAELGL